MALAATAERSGGMAIAIETHDPAVFVSMVHAPIAGTTGVRFKYVWMAWCDAQSDTTLASYERAIPVHGVVKGSCKADPVAPVAPVA